MGVDLRGALAWAAAAVSSHAAIGSAALAAMELAELALEVRRKPSVAGQLGAVPRQAANHALVECNGDGCDAVEKFV